MALNVRIRSRDLGQGLALHGRRHQRRRGLADRAALPGDADVGHRAVLDLEVDDDLVAAQRVEPLGPVRRRDGQLAPVAGAAVVVEDDLAVEVFETGHGLLAYVLVVESGACRDRYPNRVPASASASTRASTSASSL